MRIGIVGGESYDSAALDSFLWNLYEKYPDATIVTGLSKRTQSAEKHAAESAKLLGFTVEIVTDHENAEEWYGPRYKLAQVPWIMHDADVTVIVGSGARPKLALELHHMLNMTRRDQRGHIPKKNWVSGRSPGKERVVHFVAAPTAKPRRAATTRAKKKTAELAV